VVITAANLSLHYSSEPTASSPVKLLPRILMDSLLDAGVCHYMIVIRDPDTGHCIQWDFGPKGGDVHVDLPACPLQQQKGQQQQAAVHSGENLDTSDQKSGKKPSMQCIMG